MVIWVIVQIVAKSGSAYTAAEETIARVNKRSIL